AVMRRGWSQVQVVVAVPTASLDDDPGRGEHLQVPRHRQPRELERRVGPLPTRYTDLTCRSHRPSGPRQLVEDGEDDVLRGETRGLGAEHADRHASQPRRV